MELERDGGRKLCCVGTAAFSEAASAVKGWSEYEVSNPGGQECTDLIRRIGSRPVHALCGEL